MGYNWVGMNIAHFRALVHVKIIKGQAIIHGGKVAWSSLKPDEDVAGRMQHQVAADQSGAVRQAVGETFVGRPLKQSRRQKGVRRKDENSCSQRDSLSVPIADNLPHDSSGLFKSDGAALRKDPSSISVECRIETNSRGVVAAWMRTKPASAAIAAGRLLKRVVNPVRVKPCGSPTRQKRQTLESKEAAVRVGLGRAVQAGLACPALGTGAQPARKTRSSPRSSPASLRKRRVGRLRKETTRGEVLRPKSVHDAVEMCG